jgi:hypothetical protein
VEEGDDKINSILGGTANQNVDHLIIYKEPFYYCIQHPHVQNIHREEIEHHIQFSREHVGEYKTKVDDDVVFISATHMEYLIQANR